MKKISVICISFLLVMSLGLTKASACVNLDINIGVIDSVEGQLFAKIISTFIHERTGTKSIIKSFPDSEALHQAIKESKVELVIVNIDEALQANGQSLSSDSEANYLAAKKMYKAEMQLVLLKPFGQVQNDSLNAGSTSPVLAKIVLEKFPALPRLLKKLAGKIDSDATGLLLASVKDKGEKPGRVAKDFLVLKKLI